jgi:adenosylhomocysteine nucleosidase
LDAVLRVSNVRDDTVIVSAGLCGALDPTSPAGALVVPDAVRLPSGALLSVAAALQERALSAVPSGPVIRGILLSVDRLVSTPALKHALWERTGAVAVDMESGPVLAAAAARGLPALVVRAVADTADDTVSPELASVVDGQGRLRLERAARVALRRPDLLPQAWRMALASRRALRSVAHVLVSLQRSLSESPYIDIAVLGRSSS